jgi:hypothetical protein
MRMLIDAAVAALLLSGVAVAQPAASTYAGLQARPVKALSEQQTADLRAGRGMGMALAAELNGYPGPIHVIEHARELALSHEQRARMDELHAAMKAEAVPLGERLIAQESDLDRQFAARTVNPDSLAAATRAIGETQAALRAAHLKYHLSTAAALSPAQVQRYAELRGYTAGTPPAGPHGGHAHPAHRN